MARDRYLWNSGEETIHDPALAQGPMNGKQKWANFWYYHKWHTIAAVFLGVLVVLFVYTMLNKQEPDYEIGILTTSPYAEVDLAPLQAALEETVEDRNGDGKVMVTINQYDVGTSAGTDNGMATMAKLTNDLSSNQSLICFVDDNALTSYQTDYPQLFAYADGSTPPEDATDFQNIGVTWEDCPFLSSIKMTATLVSEDGSEREADMQPIFAKLNVCIRSKPEGMEEQESQRYDDYFALYQKLTQ